MNPPAASALRDLLAALRPAQWIKNALVLAALAFAWGDHTLPPQVRTAQNVLRALLAALVFCAVSSAVYLLNDLADRDADRQHPVKRRRPIAAGRVSARHALFLALALLLVAGPTAWLALPPLFSVAIWTYVVLQALYSAWLKHTALVDVMIIAIGFVLRAVAGAGATGVSFSPWLLMCTFFLALFLAVCKRRHEKVMTQAANPNGTQRPSLGQYDLALLDRLAAIAATATIVVYAMYTLAPETVDKFGTHAMGLTLPFVVFGLFRYLDLVYRHQKGDQPEKILLTDPPLIVNMGLYAASIFFIFVFTLEP